MAKKPRLPRDRELCPMCNGIGHIPKAATEDVRGVWNAYAAYHPQSVRSPARMRLIRLRLQLYPAERLIAAIHGNHQDTWCNEHDHHDIELILRLDKIEKYEATHRRLHSPRVPTGNGPGATTRLRQRVVPPELGGAS